MIFKVRVETLDGLRKTRQYGTLEAAQKFAQRYVGPTPELGRGYAVSPDGMAKVMTNSVPLADLFPGLTPDPPEPAEPPAPQKGDPCTSCGGDGYHEIPDDGYMTCHRCGGSGRE